MWQACLYKFMKPGVQVFQLGADGSLVQSASGLCVTPVNYSEPCGGQHTAQIWPEFTLVPCRLLRSSLHRHQCHSEHCEQACSVTVDCHLGQLLNLMFPSRPAKAGRLLTLSLS